MTPPATITTLVPAARPAEENTRMTPPATITTLVPAARPAEENSA